MVEQEHKDAIRCDNFGTIVVTVYSYIVIQLYSYSSFFILISVCWWSEKKIENLKRTGKALGNKRKTAKMVAGFPL